MTICFALILVLVYSIMCLSVQENNEKLHGINCKVDQHFHSAYITPVIEQVTEVTGCQSRDTSSEDQEVHILSLLSSGFDDPIGARNGYLPSVSLGVRPRWKQKDHVTTTVVILHSLTPVMWQMNLHHMGNSTSFHIVVNKPSYVVPSIAAHVSRQKLPSIKRLPSWAKSHHGAVTSFSSVSLANEITLFVGINPNAAPVCDYSSELRAANVKASYVQLQPATGCTVNSSQNNEKRFSTLHVIELNSSVLNSNIVIHLKQLTEAELSKYMIVEKNLILVLKCHSPAEWIIESAGIEGSLHVVAEYPVHIQTNPLYITVMVQEKVLPADTSALLNTVQNTFGSIDSFLKTTKANKINISVKGKTKLLIDSSQIDNSSLMEATLKSYPIFPGSDVPFFINKIKLAATDAKTKVLSEQPLSLLLVKQMSLDCFVDKMSISFPFDETMSILTSAFGSHSKLSSVTLIDTNCKAELNESHIVLQSFWNDCGTRSISNGEEMSYHNQVQFITTKYHPGKDLSNEPKHLPTDDDDYVSEDGSGSDDASSSRQKYHKEEQVIYPLPIFCAPTFVSKIINQSSSEKYELNIYTKKDFRRVVSQQSFPLNVVVHDHLFAEALIKADPRLCINVDECWLSENDGFGKDGGKKSTLIKHGCPTDLSVDILSKSHCGNQEDVDHYKMRFSFQLSEEFVNQHLFLHCRFTSCAMRDSKQMKMKQCIVNENFCVKPSLRPYLDPLRGKKFSMIVQGPLNVISKSKLEKGKDLLSFANPESSSSPENFVVDYSFDKLTGNSKKNPVSQQLVFIGLSTEAVVGIAFASFIIGAGLMATLWLIHMHTEPTRRFKQSRKQSSKQYQNENQLNYDHTECVDSSVPSSMKPMSVHICS